MVKGKIQIQLLIGVISFILIYSLFNIAGTTAFAASAADDYSTASTSLSQNIAIPIDVLENNGSNTIFFNGPCEAYIGDKIYYKMTIDMSQIAAIAGGYGSTTGYLSGNYTMTVAMSSALKPSENANQSSDINDYFEGDAVQLFELTAVPSYDSATNTITYQAKVRDKYATEGITGTELAKLLNSGLYAISKNDNTSTVTDAMKTAGYGRAKISFAGDINYKNASGTRDYTINMKGIQGDPENSTDTTLGTVGDDSQDTISATVLYKARQYAVNYSFISATNGKELPSEVTALLPASVQADDGTTVTASQPSQTTVTVSDGTWKFINYDAESKTIDGSDIAFTGTWMFEAAGSASTDGSASVNSTTGTNSPLTGVLGNNNTLYLIAALLVLAGCLSVVLINKKKHDHHNE